MSRASRSLAAIGTAARPAGSKVVLERALVLGGSLAGMLAARVLSEHAKEVVVIERDDAGAPDVVGGRPGVPQGSQVHGLLEAGRIQLERWYPGITGQLVDAGAVLSRGDTAPIYMDGIRKVTVPDVETICCSRYFLEAHVRRRTLARDNVRLVHGRATGVRVSDGRVTGVGYVPPDEDGDAGAELTEDGDFVVDAMGRSSRLGDWLERQGLPRPPTRRMRVDLNYATAVFRREAGQPDATSVISYLSPKGEDAGGGAVLVAIEDDRWMVVMAGYGGNRPGHDVDDFLAHIESCPPEFRRVATRERLVGPIVTYRQAESLRRDFHRVDGLPGGLVAAGDAVAAFNPVYGQGMTSALLHASCLSAHLRGGDAPTRPARGYFDLVRVVVDAAWQTSTFADLALPHVTGPYPRGYRLAARLSGLVARASMTDVDINRRFLRVTHMMADPGSLVRPGVLLRAAGVVRAQARAAAAERQAA